MNKTFPNKWVKKAVYDVLGGVNGITVNSIDIPIYNSRVSGRNIPQHYILLTTQTNRVNERNNCEDIWESSILIDIVTTFDSNGNPTNTGIVDDITDSVRDLVNDLTLDENSGLVIQKQILDFPNVPPIITSTENVFRNLIRIELVIN